MSPFLLITLSNLVFCSCHSASDRVWPTWQVWPSFQLVLSWPPLVVVLMSMVEVVMSLVVVVISPLQAISKSGLATGVPH